MWVSWPDHFLNQYSTSPSFPPSFFRCFPFVCFQSMFLVNKTWVWQRDRHIHTRTYTHVYAETAVELGAIETLASNVKLMNESISTETKVTRSKRITSYSEHFRFKLLSSILLRSLSCGVWMTNQGKHGATSRNICLDVNQGLILPLSQTWYFAMYG